MQRGIWLDHEIELQTLEKIMKDIILIKYKKIVLLNVNCAII